MSTQKQIEANRRNAQKSTGPRTPEGKAMSSLNATTHGFSARAVLLPHENPEDYQTLHSQLVAEWRPEGPTEEFCVTLMANAQWKLARAEYLESRLLNKETLGEPDLRCQDRVSRQQGALQRAFFKALKQLQTLQQQRESASSARASQPAKQSSAKRSHAGVPDRKPETYLDPYPAGRSFNRHDGSSLMMSPGDWLRFALFCTNPDGHHLDAPAAR
ncbi:MAG: hypothetical protein U0Q18_12990 [Bryobacteraceae bacterium]